MNTARSTRIYKQDDSVKMRNVERFILMYADCWRTEYDGEYSFDAEGVDTEREGKPINKNTGTAVPVTPKTVNSAKVTMAEEKTTEIDEANDSHKGEIAEYKSLLKQGVKLDAILLDMAANGVPQRLVNQFVADYDASIVIQMRGTTTTRCVHASFMIVHSKTMVCIMF